MTIRVLGLGNVLMGDDGFGPAVLHRLASGWSFPPNVEIADLGTPGLDLVPHLAGSDVAILVDTVRSDGVPGDVRRFEKAEILAHPPHPRVSPHDPGLKEALLALEFAGTGPSDVVLFGAIPGRTEMATALTPALGRAVEAVARAVVDELARRGANPVPKAAPEDDRAWWQR